MLISLKITWFFRWLFRYN